MENQQTKHLTHASCWSCVIILKLGFFQIDVHQNCKLTVWGKLKIIYSTQCIEMKTKPWNMLKKMKRYHWNELKNRKITNNNQSIVIKEALQSPLCTLIIKRCQCEAKMSPQHIQEFMLLKKKNMGWRGYGLQRRIIFRVNWNGATICGLIKASF